MIRELKEEAGIEVEDKDLEFRGLISFDYSNIDEIY